jgi:DNA repair protein RecO (recombination protein O)
VGETLTMPIEHSEAIVIRTIDFSETSLVLTLFTREFGKIRGIAKGARQRKNSFDSSLDLLGRISVSLIRKNSDALDLLTEAKLISRFPVGSAGIPGLYAGYYLAELLQMTTENGDAMPELYDQAVATLLRFAEGKNTEEHLCRFQWKLMTLLGERPSTGDCVACGCPIDFGEEIRRGRNIGFSMLEGGVVCTDCRRERGFRQLASINPRTAAWFARLDQTTPPSFPDEEHVRREIRSVTDWMIEFKCGRIPKTRGLFYRALAEHSPNRNQQDEENRTEQI